MSLTNTYTYEEAPSDGSAIPSGSNGVVAVGGTVTYSVAAATHGAYGVNMNGLSSAVGYSATASGQISVYGSCPTPSTSNSTFLSVRNGATLIGRVRLDSANGFFELADNSNTVVATSTNTYVSTHFRVDLRYDFTTGTSLTLTARLFLGTNIEGTVPDETLGPVTYAETLTPNRVYIGPGSTSWITYADTVRLYDDITTWPSPYSVTSAMAVAFRANAVGSANNTSAQITVPATCQVGDVIVIQLSQNNTDAITSTPAGLTLLDNNTTTSSTFPNRLYVGTVNGVTISASTTLTWALSATRSWTLNLYAASGVHPTDPVQSLQTAGAVTTTTTVTSGTIAASAWLLEIGSSKSNGTSITSWTAPSGWTIQSSAPASATTFQGSSFIADLNAGTAPASAYGGETYTPNATPNIVITYLLALNPAMVGISWTSTV